MGGNGHCFFRTWIKAENAYNNKTQDEADITKAALQLRLEAIKHMRKHTAEYKEAWCDDTMEEQYQRAGQPAPKNFEDFLKQASKKNYWVNEHLIQAVATRTGTRINRAQIVEASKELPIEERGWSCPFCNAGLPVFHGYHQKQVNIWHHYDAKHKRRNTSKEAILKTRFKQYRNNKTNLPGLWKSKEKIIAKRMENNTRDMTIGGHTLCIIRPDWASWPSKTIKNPSSRSLHHLPLGLPSGNSNGKAAEQHETER